MLFILWQYLLGRREFTEDDYRRGVYILLASVLTLFLACALASAEPWPGVVWQDLAAHSSLEAGTGVAFGSVHDFIYGRTYGGIKFPLARYRDLHLEAGVLQRIDGTAPVAYSLGVSYYVRPFADGYGLNVPERFGLLRQLYVGPVGCYDFQYWLAGLQFHLAFGGRGETPFDR